MKRNSKQPIGWLLATSLILSGGAWAAPIIINNPGFEDPPTADGGLGAPGVVPGWSVFNLGAIRVLNPSSAVDLTAEAPEGQNVGLLTGSTNEDGYSQTLTSTLQADADYALTVKVANTKFTGGFPGYRVQLLANGTLLAEDDNSQSVAEDAVATSTVNYTYTAAAAALVGQPLEIRLLSKGLIDDREVAFDDVRLDVTLLNPAANPGGPYSVAIPDGSLSLDGGASLPSAGQTITTYEWDLDNDGDFDELVTGVTPAPIDYATLTAAPPAGFGMVEGVNTIKLRVTDSAAKTSTVEGTVKLNQPLLIYEPFNDLDPSLAGNTPGLGLTGTWNGQSLVAGGSLIYGALAYEGGRAVTNPANAVDSCGVSPGTTLIDAGLMADGATLWFSALIVNHTSSLTADEQTYVSLGTGNADGFDRIGGNTGSGFTVAVSKNAEGAVTAQGWNDGSDGAGGAFRGANVAVTQDKPFLAVGKITWGPFGTPGSDVFELYLPGPDLVLPATPASKVMGDFDQLGTANAANAFDTISFAGRIALAGVPEVDEIRFGATYEAVTPKDLTAPLIVSTDPVDDSPSGNSSQQVVTFNEPVFVGTGDIRIVNDTDAVTTTIPVGDPQIVVSGNTLTITPAVPLIGGKAYHIKIDAGAVKNGSNLAFAGISSATEWNFIADGTPPTVVSIVDSVSPLPLLVNTSVTYTVTFSEAILGSSIQTTDFANSGSATVTINSVMPTGNPAVFQVGVTATGAGSLTLEIIKDAVITDLSGIPLDTTSAIPDDTTITVNNPTPTAASLLTDFQATIASEQHPTYAGEARYFHVSVNPANAGTGSYAATVTGTPDNIPAPVFVRNYTDPVLSYKFAGGAENLLGTMGVGMSGGDASLITHTTQDPAYDGFAQQQAKVWDATDPGADLATGGTPFTAVADKNAGLFRSLGGAVGTVNISGLASGSVHIYYGSFSAKPSVRVTMRDLDNVAADIVLANVHLNNDTANRSEYYLAEIDFVTDGFYDVIEYEWLANGLDYTGNGRGIGTVLTGPVVVGNDFATWVGGFGLTDITFNGDDDADNLGNGIEAFFGTVPSVSNAGITEVGKSGNTVTFSHPNPDAVDVVTDVTGSYEWSLDMVTWYADDGVEGPGATTVTTVATPDSPDPNVTTVVATIGGTVPEKLFLRVVATQP
jgi:hypothetical protein